MKLTNKEEFISKTEVYQLLSELEEAAQNKDGFRVSILLTRLKQRDITFLALDEEIDPKSQCQ